MFKWANKEAIYNNKSGKGKPATIRNIINKNNTIYIGSRSGVDLGDNPNHGIFGELHSDTSIINPEEMKLNDIGKYVYNITKEGKDVFQCVFSLKVDDAISLRL